MDKIKNNLPIILSLILALIAGGLIYSIVKAQSPTVPVVVSTQNLRVGLTITSENAARLLSVKYFPAVAAPNTSFSSIKQLEGKTIINGPIVQDSVIRAEHLSDSGSLISTLQTFAPAGWTAVELPSGAGVGMKGIKRGELVHIYGEVMMGEGLVIDKVCDEAIVLSMPDEDTPQYVVAVKDQYAPAVAGLIIRGSAITVALPNGPTKSFAPVEVEDISSGDRQEVEE